ncbi:MAG: 50S ribosomal protein L30e [Candidatus Methanofastidiosia archaeon]
MDISQEIRKTIDTGKVILGTDKSLRALISNEAKLIIYSANCKQETKGDLKHYAKLANVPIKEFKGTGVDLGMMCGKPFVVSMIAILSPGESNILSVGGE